MKKFTLTFVAAMILMVFTLNIYAASLYNQDGVGFSGSIEGKPIGNPVTITGYAGTASRDVSNPAKFTGAVYDGQGSIYAAPSQYTYPQKIDVASGTATDLTTMPAELVKGTNGFAGAVFDGTNIYFVPYDANRILKTQAGSTVLSDMYMPEGIEKDNVKFRGGVFDGTDTWMFPFVGTDFVKINKESQTVSKAELPFTIKSQDISGGVFDGTNIWLIPYNATSVISYNPKTNTHHEYSNWPSQITKASTKYTSATIAGTSLFLASADTTTVAVVDTTTGEISSLDMSAADEDTITGFTTVTYDGRNVWFSAANKIAFIKYDAYYGTKDLFKEAPVNITPGSTPYKTAVSDGYQMWFIASDASGNIAVKSGSEYPVANEASYTMTKNTTLNKNLTGSDPESDPLTFEIVEQVKNGTLTLDDAQTGAFTYTPNTDFTGTDTFTFKVSDSENQSLPATVTITVGEPEKPKGIYIDLWGHWAETAANQMTDRGYFLGEKVGTYLYFYPEHTMNRAEFILFANSVFGQKTDTKSDLPFEDINKDSPQWIINAAQDAYQSGLIHGVGGDGKVYFEPYAELTRIQALQTIYNGLKLETNSDEALDFADNDVIPAWSVQMVKDMKNFGLIQGFDDNTLRPYDKITRAQAIKMLYDAVLYQEEVNGSDPSRTRLILK